MFLQRLTRATPLAAGLTAMLVLAGCADAFRAGNGGDGCG
jgi:hypothetical protein